MFKANKWVIPYVVILSAVLLIPAVTIPFVDHDARQKWEKRSLTELPDLTQFLASPKPTFGQLDDYVNDHIGGGFQVIKGRRKFYFDTFSATNDIYIVGNDQGDYFLTSPFQQKDRKQPFLWWGNVCVKSQNPKYLRVNLKKFEKSEPRLSKFGAKVVYGMVPTKAALLQDRLPKSTPKKMQDACQNISVDNNWAVNYSKLNPDINFFYPYSAFKARASNPLFYPNTAYHWQGESTWVFTEELAAQYNLDVSPVWDEGPCKDTSVKWDIGGLIGVGQVTPGCDRNLSSLEIKVDQHFMYPLNGLAKKKAVKVVKMTNPHAVNDKTAIVFSNSFGPAVRQQIASHFKTTYHLRAGIINSVNMKALLNESDILDVDFIVVTAADFHYPDILRQIEPNEK